ncbi:MAG: hypothetical protein K2Q32_07665 [Alphaproteobacteria bacterium]|nr:hypothetical protein [Alphaproteobacteria bacterium]
MKAEIFASYSLYRVSNQKLADIAPDVEDAMFGVDPYPQSFFDGGDGSGKGASSAGRL